MIPSNWQYPKQYSQEPSEVRLLCISPDHGANRGPGHINVTELLPMHSLTDAQGTLMQCYPGASSRVTGQGALNGTVVKPVPATSALPQVLSCHEVSDIQAFLCGYGVLSMARLFWLLALLWLKTWKGQRVRVPSFPSVLSKRAGV